MTTPDVSIVMPTYNKARYLDVTLASLSGQTYPSFETVVVDDGSTDDAESVVRRYDDQTSITYMRQENRGRSAARNTAVRAARGDLIIFSDDDRILSPSFVADHVSAHADRERVVLGRQRGILSRWGRAMTVEPRIEPLLAAHPHLRRELETPEEMQLITAEDVTTAFAETIRAWEIDEPYWEAKCVPVLEEFPDLERFRLGWMLGTTGNMSARRSQVVSVGLFDEVFKGWGMEDIDLTYRLATAGAEVSISQAAVNYHQIHPSAPTRLRELFRNLAYFKRKFDGIDVLLFLMVSQRRMTAGTAHAVSEECQRLLDERRPLIVDELKSRYGHLVESGPVELASVR